MNFGEKLYFMQQSFNAFRSVGALLPTSRYAARAMVAECARRTGPKTILEVGVGTGSITAEIIKHLGPDDHLVLCEINPRFAAYLRQRIAHDPAFRRVRHQITLHATSVTDLDSSQQFDCIISAIPFTSLPWQQSRAILEHYRILLKPGGTLTYIEYAWLRTLKHQFSRGEQRRRSEKATSYLEGVIEAYQFRRDMVWRNVPPAWIRHLRLTAAQPQDALLLTPLEQIRRLGAGPCTIAAEAGPWIAGLVLPALILHNYVRRIWILPLVLAGMVAWFFRDLDRHVVQDPDMVYAASDGRVLAVEQVQDPYLGNGAWVRITVFLSLMDMHINRTPIAGKVVRLFPQSGGYTAACSRQAEHNCSFYTVLEGSHGYCAIVQRTGLVARRIVNWCAVGHILAQGEKFGLIRFGSRVDVYVPAHRVQTRVVPGDRVQAGRTVIAHYTADTSRWPAP